MRFFLLFTAVAVLLGAHTLNHTVSYQKGVVVSLQFVEEGDFSFQSYEVYGPKKSIPFQVGRTDALGRVVFVPNENGRWIVKLFSEDGHGKVVEIDVTDSIHAAAAKNNTDAGNFLKGLLGVVLILLVFGGVYIAKRRSQK